MTYLAEQIQIMAEENRKLKTQLSEAQRDKEAFYKCWQETNALCIQLQAQKGKLVCELTHAVGFKERLSAAEQLLAAAKIHIQGIPQKRPDSHEAHWGEEYSAYKASNNKQESPRD